MKTHHIEPKSSNGQTAFGNGKLDFELLTSCKLQAYLPSVKPAQSSIANREPVYLVLLPFDHNT